MSEFECSASFADTAADLERARRGAEERVRAFRKMAAAHAAAEAQADVTARKAKHALQAQQHERAERHRIEVHALNQLLASVDAREVEQAFGSQSTGCAGGLGV